MKTILSFVLAGIFYFNASLAQEKEHLELYCQSQYSGGQRSFSVFTHNHEAFLNNIKKGLPKPTEEKAVGHLIWENIAINGLSDNVTLELKDGLLENDKSNNTACWIAFSTNQVKEEKLKKNKSGDYRMMYIYVRDTNGNSLIEDLKQQEIARNFLLSKVQ